MSILVPDLHHCDCNLQSLSPSSLGVSGSLLGPIILVCAVPNQLQDPVLMKNHSYGEPPEPSAESPSSYIHIT